MALGPVKPHVKAAADAIIAQFGIKTVYGWRPADPFPDHPSGLAVDFMINNLSNGKAVGDALADYVIKNGVALGVKYLIWYKRSYNIQRGTWEKYTSTTNPHTDHVHVTWNPKPGTGVSTDPATTPVGIVDDTKEKVTAIYDVFKKISDMVEWLTDPPKRLRIEVFMIGVAVIIFGLLKFDKVAAPVGKITSAVVSKAKGAIKNGGK